MTTLSSAFKRNKQNKSTAMIAASAAALLGLGATVGLAAWTQAQQFSVNASAKTLGMKYGIDTDLDGKISGDETWEDFGGMVTLPEFSYSVDASTPDKTYGIIFKNSGDTSVTMSEYFVSPDGTLFQGTNPLTVALGSTSGGAELHAATSEEFNSSAEGLVLDIEAEHVTFVTIAVPDDLPESYSGTAGFVHITATFDQN
jgi:hypothetical protein